MPGANDIDIVYELMLRQRDVALSETLEQLSDIGSRTYLYAISYLVCLEITITEDLVSKLAKLDPLPIKFIFRGIVWTGRNTIWLNAPSVGV